MKRLARGDFKEVEPGIFESPYYFCKLRRMPKDEQTGLAGTERI